MYIFFFFVHSPIQLIFPNRLTSNTILRFLNWHSCGCTKQVAYLLVAWPLTYCSTMVCFKILPVKFVIAGMLWWRVYVRIFEGFPDSKNSYSRNNKHPTSLASLVLIVQEKHFRMPSLLRICLKNPVLGIYVVHLFYLILFLCWLAYWLQSDSTNRKAIGLIILSRASLQ